MRSSGSVVRGTSTGVADGGGLAHICWTAVTVVAVDSLAVPPFHVAAPAPGAHTRAVTLALATVTAGLLAVAAITRCARSVAGPTATAERKALLELHVDEADTDILEELRDVVESAARRPFNRVVLPGWYRLMRMLR